MSIGKKLCLIFFIAMMPQALISDGTDGIKGIWTSIKNFPLFTSSFWSGIGQSFGAPPTGYVYSFDVVNDTRQELYVSVNEIMSFMGGNFPKTNGFNIVTLPSCLQDPKNHYVVNNQDYYFEMLIRSSNGKYSSNMPYLPHDDVLLRKDAISLDEPNSKKINYYRTFMGKKLNNGNYVHIPKAEYLGYKNQDTAAAKTDPGNVTVGTNLTSLTIYNSTQTDYFIGFINQAKSTGMTPQTCQIFTKVFANSFAKLSSFAALLSFTPGTIGLFDTNKQLLQTYNLPSQIFENLPYTLEIYQDGASLQMDLQGLISGNYDLPIGFVRDIAPVQCVFWYESEQQFGQQGYMDLPGKVWILAIADTAEIIAGVAPGESVAYSILRPNKEQKLWIYFIYVAISDDKNDVKAQQYLENFIKGSWALSVLQSYQQQATQQQQMIQQQVNVAGSKKSTTTPASVLVQAAQGILTMNGGQVIDSETGIAGYLLGGDVFLTNGVGAGPMYYVLLPSMQNSQNLPLPQATVQNMYIINPASTKAPDHMPTPTVINKIFGS